MFGLALLECFMWNGGMFYVSSPLYKGLFSFGFVPLVNNFIETMCLHGYWQSLLDLLRTVWFIATSNV